ncbi:MAG TPA: VOC family protein [Acidimicrobiales bacterium]|nr:VOC family protein [Acidimicrobiales bacterium]
MVLGLDALEVGDDPAAWSAAGFAVQDGEVVIGRVRIRCLDDGGGADRWRLRTEPGGPDVPSSVDGLATSTTTDEPAPPVVHPNGIVAVDHVVLRSPDLDRTTAAFGALGLDLRRTRDVGTADRPMQQRFFRLGDVILELVGPSTPAGDGPCSIWGYAVVSDDLDATAEALGDACSPPKEAVQPGRRIATIRTRELGIGVTLAVMTPHVKAR